MNAREILNNFGRLLITNVYDPMLADFRYLRNGKLKWGIGEDYAAMIKRLSDADKDLLDKYIEEKANTAIFSFLKVFEENTDYKITFSHKGREVDLNHESEMLKAEHHGEDGWIAKFSQESRPQ